MLHPDVLDRLIRQIAVEDVIRLAKVRLGVDVLEAGLDATAKKAVEVFQAYPFGQIKKGPAWLVIQSERCAFPNPTCCGSCFPSTYSAHETGTSESTSEPMERVVAKAAVCESLKIWRLNGPRSR
jgi:hypothetical protein